MKGRKKFIKFFFFTVLASMTLSSCHSSKNSTRWEDPIYAKDAPAHKKGPSDSLHERPDVTTDGPRRKVVDAACAWIGVPYRYGGDSRSGVDCSGLVCMAFQKGAGIKLPRSSREQHSFCKEVSRKKIKPGDLLFFTNNKGGGRINHVGIYVGNNKMIHSSSSRGVIISSLDEDYWATHFHSCGNALD